MSAKPKDLTDKHFERLIPKKIVGKDSRGNYIWYCECSCGNTVNVTATALVTGRKKSCGCLRRENAKEKNRKKLLTRQGHMEKQYTIISYLERYDKKNYKSEPLKL